MSKSVASKNPYLEAKREWSSRYGDLAISVRNWQIVSGVSCLVAVLFSVGLFVVSVQRKVVPYIVEVDSLGDVGRVVRAEYRPERSEKFVRYFLSSFIKNARGISPDGITIKENLDRAYSYVVGQGRTLLNEYYKKRKPFSRAKNELVSVEIKSILSLAKDSWKIRWIEVTRLHDGSPIKRENFEAVVKVSIREPKTEKEIIKNPLGLYITEISWSPVL